MKTFTDDFIEESSSYVFDEPIDWPEKEELLATGYLQLRIPCYHLDSSSSLPTQTDFARAITAIMQKMTWSYKTIWTFLFVPDDANGVRRLRKFKIVESPHGTIACAGRDNSKKRFMVTEL